MPTIMLTVDECGRPVGVTADDQVMYARWRARVREMRPGDTVQFSYDVARCEKLHGKYFKVLAVLLDNQEIFQTERELREWVERGARHVETLKVGGTDVERVRSVNYASLDGDEFALFFNKVTGFLLSHDALRRLWPSVDVSVSYDGMQAILEGRHA